MKFCSLSSGSDGNSQYIEYKNTKILIDAGCSGKKIAELLSSIGVNINDIDAIFVTHEHIDHAKGVGVLSRRHNIKVFTTHKTHSAMTQITKEISSDCLYFFENEKAFYFKDLYIDPMKSSHDALDSTCFNIIGKKKISIVTDTGYISESMLKRMDNASLYYMEANHDLKMLINGSYPFSLKQRIASNIGHLSNDTAAENLKKLLNKKNEIVMLSHLSKDNNMPMLATRTIRDSLNSSNIREGIDYILEVSPKTKASTIHKL